MWQLTSEGENSSSPLLYLPIAHVYSVCISNPVRSGLLTHLMLAPGKVTFTFVGLASPPCYGFMEQSGKEPNVSVCWSL